MPKINRTSDQLGYMLSRRKRAFSLDIKKVPESFFLKNLMSGSERGTF